MSASVQHISSRDYDRIVGSYETLKRIHAESTDGRRTHLQVVDEMATSWSKLQVLLTPLGFETRPLDVREARRLAWSDVDRVLSRWHGEKYSHGNETHEIIWNPQDLKKLQEILLARLLASLQCSCLTGKSEFPLLSTASAMKTPLLSI
ncbi:hypothetical protein AC1031_021041 [Aphanomyces cochlioides]|nr:hypothetical protein AC1031_021041 [Aphanomyces cochlioides]